MNYGKYNENTSYCVHETNNDCLIFCIGDQWNDKIPNVEYSMKNDKYDELPLTQTKRDNNSIYNMNHGLITFGGNNDNDGTLSSVEILKDKKEWKYLSSMNNKRSNCSSTTIENKLFVFGGHNNQDNKFVTMVEMCDLNNDKDKIKIIIMKIITFYCSQTIKM